MELGRTQVSPKQEALIFRNLLKQAWEELLSF
jgi:hypothetical protein